MKKIQLFLVVLAIFAFTVPVVSAADSYATLKNAYIVNNPGQSLIPFPWDPLNSTRILPINYVIPAAPGETVAITACPDQTEAASFILSAQKDLSGIQITAQDLSDGQGNNIPATAINIRTVKVWYQSAYNDLFVQSPGYYLTPELLLKDDSLVKVDYTNKVNFLKVTINGVSQYVDISSPSAIFPSAARINDAASLQPFPLSANENKQIWMTVKVPADVPAGDYTGYIAVTAPGEKTVRMKFTVKVLPFTLEPAPLDYGLYYRGMLPSDASENAQVTISGIWKTPAQYSLELQDMKDHGVSYPTLNQWSSGGGAWAATFDQSLSLRQQAGFPTKNIFALGLATGNPTSAAALSTLKTSVNQWNTAASKYGYRNVYIGGIDEADSATLKTESAAWETVHSTGAKVFAPVSYNLNAYNVVGDTLDVVVLAGKLNATQASLWHSKGKLIYSYANPQAGIEDPGLYRKNYGFALWNAGYDGVLDYAYQDAYGKNVWNDYDTPNPNGAWVARDHVFAYPTSNGVIDTIEWEGWQEGVDDTRFLATLIKQDGSSTAARTLVASSLSSSKTEMGTIRNKIIAKISPSTPAPQPTVTPTPVPTPIPTPTPTAQPTVTPTPVPTPIPTPTPTVQPTATPTPVPTPIPTPTPTAQPTVTPTPTTPPAMAGSIATTSPNGGETWNPGTTPTLHWTSTGTTGTKVKIELLKGTTTVQTLSSSTPNDGTYSSWAIPASIGSGTDYKIRITSVANTAIADSSDSAFAISTPSLINVTSPAAGSTSKTGIYRNGTWLLDDNGDGVFTTGTDKTYVFGAPTGTPVLGDWNGDHVTEIGVTNSVDWYIDVNGDGVWNPTQDRHAFFGIPGFRPVVGQWTGNNITKIGVTNGIDWYLDANGDGVWNAAEDQHAFFGIPGYTPITGDWTGTGRTRIGVTNGVDWYLDLNGNGVWDGPAIDEHCNFGIPGFTPVVGDWTGTGRTRIGVTNGVDWYLDLNGNGVWDGPATDEHCNFGIPGYTPVVGDWTGDGTANIGVTNGVDWYLDANGNGVWDGAPADLHNSFGTPGWTPLTGKWN